MNGKTVLACYALFIVLLFILPAGCAAPTPGAGTEPGVGGVEAGQGGGQPAQAVGKINIGVLRGPTGMGIVRLMDDEAYNIIVAGSPEDLIGKIVTAEVDLAAVPTNLAAILYQRTGQKIRLLAINTLGVLYILEDGDEINAISDLKGRTLYASGKGATPDFVLQYLLREHGLEPGKDVILDFSTQHGELATLLAAGQRGLGLLPQPHVTTVLMQNENMRIALDLTREWKGLLDQELPMGVLIGQKGFIQDNAGGLADFLRAYEQSINFVNDNPAEAAALIAGHGLLPNAAVAARAIPYSNMVYIDAAAGKGYLHDFFQVLYRFDPESIGGKMPDDQFYYTYE